MKKIDISKIKRGDKVIVHCRTQEEWDKIIEKFNIERINSSEFNIGSDFATDAIWFEDMCTGDYHKALGVISKYWKDYTFLEASDILKPKSTKRKSKLGIKPKDIKAVADKLRKDSLIGRMAEVVAAIGWVAEGYLGRIGVIKKILRNGAAVILIDGLDIVVQKYRLLDEPKEYDMCPHCKTPKSIRNESGYCDHLNYPDNCEVCKPKEEKKVYVIVGSEDFYPSIEEAKQEISKLEKYRNELNICEVTKKYAVRKVETLEVTEESL